MYKLLNFYISLLYIGVPALSAFISVVKILHISFLISAVQWNLDIHTTFFATREQTLVNFEKNFRSKILEDLYLHVLICMADVIVEIL